MQVPALVLRMLGAFTSSRWCVFEKSCDFVTTVYVTGPAKIGHVGTNYILKCYSSYLSTGAEYLHSVTCIIKPTKCLLTAENCIAIA